MFQLCELKTIDTFSELCDEITKDKQSTDYTIEDLLERMGSLENDHSKLENTVVDLQCRSMRDNLIFTGIDEVDLGEGEHEDVEKTLETFLETEMHIYRPTEFHRVHHIGPLDKTSVEPRPRPIIVKFEKFKDRKNTTDQSHVYRKARERSIFPCPFQINTTHS